MTDASPTPPNRQDPHVDPADDSDEPAFDWMKPATGKQPQTSAAPAVAAGAPDDTPAGRAPSGQPAPGQPAAPPLEPAASGLNRQGRRAEPAAADDPAGGRSEDGTAFSEKLPTSTLQVRPPQADVERRNAQREAAAKTKPVLPRVMQVMLAVVYPVILLVLAVRAVATPLFLWVEYNRPGFPGDGYGFSTDDRMTYGSYAVDYLTNWAGPRYLGDLIGRSGDKLFQPGEVSHMADVKMVIQSTLAAGAVLMLLALIAVIYLRRRSPGGVRRGLFAGSILTLTIIIGIGVLAVLNWEQFFTEFHRIFFASGTWTFSLQDTLIRLFPGQFWVDAGIVIGVLVVLTSLATLIFTWPTRKRRGLARHASGEGARRKGSRTKDTAGQPAEPAGESAAPVDSAHPGGSADAAADAAAGSPARSSGDEEPGQGSTAAR